MELRDQIITEPVLFLTADPCSKCGRPVEVEDTCCTWCAAALAQILHPAESPKKDPEWNRRADLYLSLLYVGIQFTADDLIDDVGLPTGSLNQIGAKFRAWAKADRIRMAGTRTSTRPATHGRLIRCWQVTA